MTLPRIHCRPRTYALKTFDLQYTSELEGDLRLKKDSEMAPAYLNDRETSVIRCEHLIY